ncbi:hypothetical protein [Loigolactobacillus binensis]|uniref:Uncharacterized protein n=1 Tax=Loigolactobacillus binensis TaxID=2559922 RepID=A0ABW3EDK4_9LACO|nr:hypothetical protein [Loigolactobacillus binensis]
MKLADFFQTAVIAGTPVMRSDYELKTKGLKVLQLPLPALAQIYYDYFYTTRYVTQNFELNKMEIADIKAELQLSDLSNQLFQQDLKQIVVEVDVRPAEKQVVLALRHDG